jgi:hypothetical protein
MHVLDKIDPGVGTTFGAYKNGLDFPAVRHDLANVECICHVSCCELIVHDF